MLQPTAAVLACLSESAPRLRVPGYVYPPSPDTPDNGMTRTVGRGPCQ